MERAAQDCFALGIRRIGEKKIHGTQGTPISAPVSHAAATIINVGWIGTVFHDNYHSFHMDLQADHEGNFYYAVCGNQMALAKPDQACVIKVSKYGDKAEVYSTGLRAANGLGMGPNDELTVADNQGRVRGVSGLRVVDASLFPCVPCANTNFPTLMTAEKISDMVLAGA